MNPPWRVAAACGSRQPHADQADRLRRAERGLRRAARGAASSPRATTGRTRAAGRAARARARDVLAGQARGQGEGRQLGARAVPGRAPGRRAPPEGPAAALRRRRAAELHALRRLLERHGPGRPAPAAAQGGPGGAARCWPRRRSTTGCRPASRRCARARTWPRSRPARRRARPAGRRSPTRSASSASASPRRRRRSARAAAASPARIPSRRRTRRRPRRGARSSGAAAPTRVPAPSGRKRTATSLALAGSGTGTRSGLICHVNARREGGSQVRTRPQSQRRPCGPRSKQTPPSRGSMPISSSTSCDQVYSRGHHSPKRSVKVANASAGGAGTVIETVTGAGWLTTAAAGSCAIRRSWLCGTPVTGPAG